MVEFAFWLRGGDRQGGGCALHRLASMCVIFLCVCARAGWICLCVYIIVSSVGVCRRLGLSACEEHGAARVAFCERAPRSPPSVTGKRG